MRHEDLWVAIEFELRGLHPVTQAIDDWRRVTVAYTSDHPAALGCLLAIVRDLWNDIGASTSLAIIGGKHYWNVIVRAPGGGGVTVAATAGTEGEALLAALQAAPQKGMRKHPIIIAKPAAASGSAAKLAHLAEITTRLDERELEATMMLAQAPTEAQAALAEIADLKADVAEVRRRLLGQDG
jgi:hypothetical protein